MHKGPVSGCRHGAVVLGGAFTSASACLLPAPLGFQQRVSRTPPVHPSGKMVPLEADSVRSHSRRVFFVGRQAGMELFARWLAVCRAYMHPRHRHAPRVRHRPSVAPATSSEAAHWLTPGLAV